MAGIPSEEVEMEWTQSFASEEVTHKLFGNELIWKRLGQFLKLSDLKRCRSVSRNFNKQVLGSTSFLRRATVILDHNNLHRGAFSHEFSNWKNAEISVAGTTNIEDLAGLESRLSELDSLTVSLRKEGRGFRRFDFSLTKLLELASKLKKLKVALEFLMLQNEHTRRTLDVPLSEKSRSTLRNLTELKFQGLGIFTLDLSFMQGLHEYIDSWIPALVNLRNLSVDFVTNPAVALVGNYFAQIARANKQHLTDFRMDNSYFWTVASRPKHPNTKLIEVDTSDLIFPCMKALQIGAVESESCYRLVAEFIQQQPLLCDIELSSPLLIHSTVLRTISERSSQLKRLSIQACQLGRITKDKQFWSFLRSIEDMNEISIIVNRRTCWLNANDVLTNLPASVARIILGGLHYGPAFEKISVSSFSSVNPGLLTRLEIRHCGPCLDDEVMQFIFGTLKMLRILAFSYIGPEVTPYGFTGLPEDPNGPSYSLANLEGLESLMLVACEAISDATVSVGVRFRHLRQLDLRENPHITSAAIFDVLEHNPSLEVFRSSISVSEVEVKKTHQLVDYQCRPVTTDEASFHLLSYNEQIDGEMSLTQWWYPESGVEGDPVEESDDSETSYESSDSDSSEWEDSSDTGEDDGFND